MRYHQYPRRDSIKNYFPLPNELFALGLCAGEIAVYAFLMCCEDRDSYTCVLSYKEIGAATGKEISITGYEHHSYTTGFTNWELLQSTGKITNYSEYRLYTHVDGMPGQSGSPVVYNGNVVGIYTYSAGSRYFLDDSSSENNGITRITTTVKNNIENF